MDTISQIADKIGRAAISKRTGTGASAVSNAVSFGKFPPGWYRIIVDLGDEKGIKIPDNMFNWRKSVVDEASK